MKRLHAKSCIEIIGRESSWRVRGLTELSVSGIYTNYYGKGCQRTSRGTIGKNCKHGGQPPQRVDVQVGEKFIKSYWVF